MTCLTVSFMCKTTLYFYNDHVRDGVESLERVSRGRVYIEVDHLTVNKLLERVILGEQDAEKGVGS